MVASRFFPIFSDVIGMDSFCALVIRGFSGIMVPSKVFLRVATPELIQKELGHLRRGTKSDFDGSTE